MTRHIHADNIIIAANDTSIQWQAAHKILPTDWVGILGEPAWDPRQLYRQVPRPKKMVDMWQWANVSKNGNTYSSICFYKTEEEAQEKLGDMKLCRIEGSKITVEVDE